MSQHMCRAAPHIWLSRTTTWCDTYHTRTTSHNAHVVAWTRECAHVAVWRGLHACHERYADMTPIRVTHAITSSTHLLPDMVSIITSYDPPRAEMLSCLAAWHVLQHDMTRYSDIQHALCRMREAKTVTQISIGADMT